MSVEILPIATQQCRNYLYDKSWTNRSYDVGPMFNKHVHSTMTRSSRFHCLIGVINKPTTDVLWISPVYRRLAEAKFSTPTMWKLLAWPWPRPLREHSLITRLRFRMANSHKKLKYLALAVAQTWGVKFYKGSPDPDHAPSREVFSSARWDATRRDS